MKNKVRIICINVSGDLIMCFFWRFENAVFSSLKGYKICSRIGGHHTYLLDNYHNIQYKKPWDE